MEVKSSSLYPVMGDFSIGNMTPIDISVVKLSNFKSLDEMDDILDSYINDFQSQSNVTYAYGGYLEKRGLYAASPHFYSSEMRDIHLGVDVWAEAHTPIYAPYDCKIHSYKYNKKRTDYGHCLILKSQDYHILFGHLSPSYLKLLAGLKNVKKGQLIGHIGEKNTNGGWTPHLHLQLIKDIGDYNGDYPGVCAISNLDFYVRNCPNPTFLLGF